MARRKKADSSGSGRKWKIGDVGKFLGRSLIAMFRGEFLMRMRIDKYFPQIAYTFLLSLLAILFNLMVDKTLVKVEDNKRTLQELEIQHTQKTYELVQMTRRSNVSRLLKESGSAVSEPTTPAKVIRPSSGSKGTAARAEKKAREQKDSTEVNESQDNG